MTQSFREFKYYVVRYVPDIAKGESINVAVILSEVLPKRNTRVSASRRFFGIVVREQLEALRSIDGNVELDLVADQILYLRKRVHDADAGDSRSRYLLLKELVNYSNSLVLSCERGLRAESAEAALQQLSTMYL